MTITYPRILLSGDFVDCTFDLVEPVSRSRTQGGRSISAVEYADPYITAKIETAPLAREQRAAWEAWRASLRGGLKTFVTHDLSRPELIAYPNGVPQIKASTWDGEGNVSALTAHLITATGVPTGIVMSPGDLIGLVEDGRRAVFFVSEQATAGATTIAVPVEPAISLQVFSTAATAVFWRPTAEFILQSESWSSPKREFLAPVTFEAVQKI